MRRIVRSVVALAGAVVVSLAAPAPAEAACPHGLSALAADQTRQTMRYLTTAFAQNSSPVSCAQAASSSGVLLLPTLAGLAGDHTFHCTTRSHAALVDLGGFVVTEDNDPTDTWTTADGTVLRFSHGNLATIAADVIRIVTPATSTVDGRATSGGTAVSTDEFVTTVQRSTGSYWDSSVALGHPGRLWTAFGGYKQVVPLARGRHTIVVDLSAIIGAPTTFTYVIDVCA